MPHALTYILGLVAIVVGIWLFFGIASIALAGLSVMVSKAVKVGKCPADFHLSLIGVVLFCAAISITVLLGSSFLRIFSSLFVEFPQSTETFESGILNDSVNFGIDVCIGMIAALIGWRWFPPIIAAALLPLFYLVSSWTLWVMISPKLSVLFSASNVSSSLTQWLDGMRATLNLIISPGEWAATFNQMFLEGGGNILVFEPFFAIAIILVAIIEIFLSFAKTGTTTAHINRSALYIATVSLGAFLGAVLIFWGYANGALIPDNPPLWLGLILALIGLPLQVISFAAFVIAFIVFTLSAFAIFPLSAKKALVSEMSAD